MPKSRKGSVAVQSVKDRLRLCWSHEGKRYFLSLLLPDTKINRAEAQLTASLIEEDIRTRNFDSTLTKYRRGEQRQGDCPASALLDKFIRHKSPRFSASTTAKYRWLQKVLVEYLGRDKAIAAKEATNFLDWYSKRIKPITLATRASNLQSVWEWGIEQGLVQANPWKQAKKSLPKISALQPKPFTENEIKRILEWFRQDERSRHYADFVEFRLRTGCRSGEAAGLRWGHLSPDCTTIRISETVVRGKRQSTKTGREREFLLSKPCQELLQKRKPADAKPDDLVFTTVTGCPIEASGFAKHYWKPALEELGIPYRKPYNTRATFVSHALYNGANPVELTELTGHSKDVMFNHYLGAIRKSKLPDLWE